MERKPRIIVLSAIAALFAVLFSLVMFSGNDRTITQNEALDSSDVIIELGVGSTDNRTKPSFGEPKPVPAEVLSEFPKLRGMFYGADECAREAEAMPSFVNLVPCMPPTTELTPSEAEYLLDNLNFKARGKFYGKDPNSIYETYVSYNHKIYGMGITYYNQTR